jgi:hypothetical protein
LALLTAPAREGRESRPVISFRGAEPPAERGPARAILGSMATKKQRRRREKLQRHEYEYVVENEEGEEVVVESPRGDGAPPAVKQGQVVDARGRVVQPTSWGRVLKRSLIFGPILAVLIFLTGGSLSTEAKIVNIVLLLLIFLPMSYVVDMLIYRSVKKRQQRNAGDQGATGRRQ